MPDPLEGSHLMGFQVINHQDGFPNPEKMTEITAESIGVRTRAISQDILDGTTIYEMMQTSCKRSAIILLAAWLSFPIKQDHIVRLALEKIVAILRLLVPALAGILQEILTMVVQDEGGCIGMGVVPSIARFHTECRCIFVPTVTHRSPPHLAKEM